MTHRYTIFLYQVFDFQTDSILGHVLDGIRQFSIPKNRTKIIASVTIYTCNIQKKHSVSLFQQLIVYYALPFCLIHPKRGRISGSLGWGLKMSEKEVVLCMRDINNSKAPYVPKKFLKAPLLGEFMGVLTINISKDIQTLLYYQLLLGLILFKRCFSDYFILCSIPEVSTQFLSNKRSRRFSPFKDGGQCQLAHVFFLTKVWLTD